MHVTENRTRIRYAVVASATLMSLLLYLDRFCISVAERYIQQDLGLTNTQVGWMLSAFFWTYALGQVPAGWLTDRFGSRVMLTAYVLMWSLLTGLTGAVGTFGALIVVRLGFGFAQAGAYPTAGSIVSQWVPAAVRGTCSSVIAFGGRVGGFLAMFITGFLLVALTPLKTPTTLDAADVLDAPQLFRILQVKNQPTGQSGLLPKVQNRLSPATRECLQATHAENSIDAACLTLIVDDLNRIIAEQDVFNFDDVRGVACEKEATRLLTLESSSRTDIQHQRLNRLLLEALFPDSIRKLYVAGWRPMMFVFGSLGVVVAALIWRHCHRSPARHPRCNTAEVAFIQSDHPRSAQSPPVSGVPLTALMRSRSMWLCCMSQWFTNVGWVFLMTWAPRYFASAHHVPIEERALLVAIPPLVGWAGMLAGGAVTDLGVRRLGLRWGRALPLSMSRFVAMAAYIACLFEPNAWTAVALFSVVAFATDLGTGATWAFSQDVGGRYVGSVLGWGNMWGNLGAAITPPLLIWIVGDAEQWNYAFMACAGAFFVAGVAAIGINAEIPIVNDDAVPPLTAGLARV